MALAGAIGGGGGGEAFLGGVAAFDSPGASAAGLLDARVGDCLVGDFGAALPGITRGVACFVVSEPGGLADIISFNLSNALNLPYRKNKALIYF